MNVLGLMSGSSLDGLDMALCNFEGNPEKGLSYRLLSHQEIKFPGSLVRELGNATELSAYDLYKLDASFSKFLGQCCFDYIKKSKYQVDIIASHGHTVFHSPENHFTKQIGNGGIISYHAKCDVISDFRSTDLAAEGQGAPFAPLADYYLWPKIDVMINLGGIANLSAKKKEGIVAFDVCPANQLLNHLVAGKGLEYDEGGQIARTGLVKVDLLASLKFANNLINANPRAMDNSWVRRNFFPLFEHYSIEDGLRTCIEFISNEIKRAVTLTYSPNSKKKSAMITGGGAFNTLLFEEIVQKLSEVDLYVVEADENMINFKEAILMALMGYLRCEREQNVFHSYTGAKENTIGGCIYAYK